VIRWLRARPITSFLVLAFGISYLIGFPGLMAYSAWAPPQPRVLQTYFSRVLVVWGPGLAAILLTWIAQGSEGVIGLLSRLVPHRSDLPWAMWIFLAGATSSGLALGLAGVSVDELSGAIRSAGVLLLGHFVLQVVIVSAGEELGWRGWLLPRLSERGTRLRATLITAACWGSGTDLYSCPALRLPHSSCSRCSGCL
jgi:membrane protease YdiL (CAAX protease family)